MRSRAKPRYVMRRRARALATVQRRHAITENENTKQSTKRCQDLYVEVRIQDFTDLQGSRFYRKQILTAVCTLFSVLVFCNTKRLLYYMDGFCTPNRRFHRGHRSGRITKNKKGLVLQIVTWGALVHWYKNTEGPCITDCNMGGSCTLVQAALYYSL